jgi:hypothetical protein
MLQWPDDRNLIPHYPVSVASGIPIFYGAYWFDMMGPVFTIEPELKHFQLNGSLISKPITFSKNPFRPLLALSKTELWPFQSWWQSEVPDQLPSIERFRDCATVQMASLCEGFPLKRSSFKSDEEWGQALAKLAAEFDTAGMIWDERRCMFVRKTS